MSDTGSVLAIFGPTASGKSAVAEAIADLIPAELVGADSMQIYRGLPILTNQPERPTRLVGVWPLDEQGTVGEYQPLAHATIDEILAEGRTPILVGGSGLYLRAALVDLAHPQPAVDRARWERLYDRRGGDTAHGLLRGRDPRAASQVHPNDRKRVVRALELWSAGSSLAPERPQLWTDETRHPTLIVGLEVPREVIDERIRSRTREMFERGVEREAREAGAVAPQVLGLEALRSLPRDRAEDEIVQATHRLAAYQRKWMRRIPGLVSVRGDRPPDEVADDILEMARARELLPRPGRS